VGDGVFKVGRTTGLTHGTITDVATTVGPVGYDLGDCWFRRSITIEGTNGTLFSDHGDSGSAILNSSGEVVALLYAGNGTQTYACPIGTVLSALTCNLI
jgi:S1-C subfamily serine protease